MQNFGVKNFGVRVKASEKLWGQSQSFGVRVVCQTFPKALSEKLSRSAQFGVTQFGVRGQRRLHSLVSEVSGACSVGVPHSGQGRRSFGVKVAQHRRTL